MPDAVPEIDAISKPRPPWADFLCVAFIVALAAAYVWPALFSGRAFGPYDLLRYQYPWGLSLHTDARPANPEAQDFVHSFNPWRTQYSRSLRDGQVPLWNPHQFCGVPLAANDQSAVFYPLNLLFVVLPVWRAFGVSAFIHLIMAGVFMFLFLRTLRAARGAALVAAAAFMFTSWNVLWMSHASKFDAAAWTPLVFMFFELSLRRKGLRPILFTAAALGLQFTAGFLQVSLYTVYGLLIYGTVRATNQKQRSAATPARAAVVLIAPCAVAAAVAAVHIIPVLELAAISKRNIIQHHFGMFPGIPYKWLLTIFLPNVFGNPTLPSTTHSVNYTENCCYIGASVLILAVVAAAAWKTTARRHPQFPALAVLAAAGLVSAMGTPLYLFFYYLMPGAKTLAVGRIVFLFCFAMSALCGLGAHAALVYVNKSRFRKSVLLFNAILLAVVVMELFTWARGFNPSVSRALAFPDTPSLKFLSNQAARGRPFRVHATAWDPESQSFLGVNLFPNTATVYGLDDFRGYDSLFPKRYREFIEQVHKRSERNAFRQSTSVTTQTTDSPWLDFMNVEYLLAVWPPPHPGWAGAFHAPADVPVYRNTRAMPRAAVYGRWRVVADKRDVLKEVMKANPRNEVVLEQPPPGLPHESTTRFTAMNQNKQASVKGENPISIQTKGPGLLVISNSYDPGWRAYDRKRRLPVLRANYVFTAVPLAENRNYSITMKYEPFSVKLGIIISCLCTAALLAALAMTVHNRDAEPRE